MTRPTAARDAWERLAYSQEKSEALSRTHRSFAGDVWFRFRHKPTALIGLVLIALILLFAIFGPMLSEHSYRKQDLSFVNIPPRLDVLLMGDDRIYITKNLKPIHVAEDGTLISALPRIHEDLSRKVTTYDFYGEQVAVDYSDRTPKLIGPDGERVRYFVTVWNKSYLLGTDKLGRDLLTRLMVGARISLLVAFIAAFTNLVIGILYGGVSAYVGGNTHNIMMRIVDVVSTIPLTL